MARVQLVVVDTVDQRQIGAGSRRGDQHALGASVQMFRGALLIGEDAGAFHRDIDVEFFPRQLCWVAFGRDFYLAFTEIHPIIAGADLGVELSMYRVVFQKVGVAFRIAEIVDADEFDIFAARLNCGSHDQTSNTAKTIDSHTHCHFSFPYTRSRMAASTADAVMPKC